MSSNTLSTAGAWSVRVLAAAALGLSGYLLYASLTTEPVAGCGWSSFDCDSALASHWAKWFGAPVAGGGLLIYFAVFAGSLLFGARRTNASALGWRILEATVPLAAGAAIWFVGVQLFALESFCVYCLLTHGCGLAIAAIVLLLRLTAERDESRAPSLGAVGLGGPAADAPDEASGPPDLGLPTVFAVIALVALISGQVFGPVETPVQTVVEASDLLKVLSFDDDPVPSARGDDEFSADTPAVETTPAEGEPRSARRPRPARRAGGQRFVRLLNGNLTIDTYAHPVLGSPDAEHVVAELMDYACPHCRDFHEQLEEAIDRFEGRMAVIVMPVPGEILCNPYVKKSRPKSRGACDIAKVSLASAMIAPEFFPEFHHWLLQGERLPQYTSALIEAQRYADRGRLSRTVRDDSGEIETRIERNVSLMAALQKLGKLGLPTQILPGRVVSGPTESVDKLCELWAAEFGIAKPVDATPLPF